MIELFMSGNDRMFDGMLIAVLSMIRHTCRPIHLIILTMDWTEQRPEYAPITERQADYLQMILRTRCADSRVTRIDVRDLYQRRLMCSANRHTAYTPYSMLRLLIDDMPELPDQLLYLDTDIVVNGDIGALYDVDMDGWEIAGVKDAYGSRWIRPDYINSGVLRINRRMIVETGLFRRACEMCSRRRMLMPDQTALNWLARRKKILPSIYNAQNGYVPDAVIIHFAKRVRWWPVFHFENIKPWQVERVRAKMGILPFDDVLTDYQNRLQQYTDWKG